MREWLQREWERKVCEISVQKREGEVRERKGERISPLSAGQCGFLPWRRTCVAQLEAS